MKKALVETSTGKVVNVIVTGPEYVTPPGHELQDANGAAKNKIWNGTGFDSIPDSHFQEIADHVISNADETLAEALFIVGKAANTGDWSAFNLDDGTPVTSKSLFMDWLKELYRAKHG